MIAAGCTNGANSEYRAYVPLPPRISATISDGKKTTSSDGATTSTSIDVKVTAQGEPFIFQIAYLTLTSGGEFYYSGSDRKTWFTFNRDGWPEEWDVTAVLHEASTYGESESVSVRVKVSDVRHRSYGTTVFSTELYPKWNDARTGTQ